MLNLSNFKPIPGYEDYLINENGQVYSKKRNKLLSPFYNRRGYLRVNLYRNKKRKFFSIHRLVAMTFLNNSNNLPQVNHIDGNKLNNNISNLEWCTNFQNNKHAWDNGLKENTRESLVRHLDDNLKELFDDIFKNQLKQKDISKKYNLKSSYVSNIKNKRKLKTAISEYFGASNNEQQ